MRYLTVEVTEAHFAQLNGKMYFTIQEPELSRVWIIKGMKLGNPVENSALELLILAQRKLIKIYLEQMNYPLAQDVKLAYRLKLESAKELLSQYVKANCDLS